MKITLPVPRPRNPFVAASMRRSAGSHRPGQRTRRQDIGRAIRRDLVEMKDIP